MKNSNTINRRDFLTSLGAASVSLSMINPNTLLADEPKQKIRLGFIGCGNRARWISKLFLNHGGYEITAIADYFMDRVDFIGELRGVPENRRFTTLSCHKKLLDCPDVDAVVIVSPSYFHPTQAQAAVDAGKHVYLAKPIAVDVPGCKTIEQAGKTATQKKLCFLVDFQTRANDHYLEAIKRVHSGAIGDLVFGEAIYHCNRAQIKTEPGTPEEARLRNWLFDIALSGDIIVEQNIHALDVMNWVVNTPPLHVTGTGGRKVRTDTGDAWDYFTLTYEYPNRIGVAFSSRQFNAQDTKPDGIRNRFFGTEGVLETEYGGFVLLRAKDYYKGKTEQIYKEGAIKNIADFYLYVLDGNVENATVPPSVQSNLVAILGRTAAYQNRRVTWNELLRSTEQLDPKLEGLKS